tara:strand:+ start:163 stop:660 length:498 start_codon:yes stop_codon:yes gene_type:complete
MTVISSAGAFKINNAASFPAIVSYTVGEAITQTFYGNPTSIIDSTMVLNQGFEQPTRWWVITLDPENPSDIPTTETDFTKSSVIEDNLSMFPNPYTDQLTVQRDDIERDLVLMIFNSEGTLCKKILIDQKMQNLYLEDLSPGSYFFEFFNEFENTSTIKKVIKSH